jgi:hypothetical protein
MDTIAPKMPDLNAKTFTANGKTYTRLSSLPVGRYEEYERLQIEFAFNASFENLFKAMQAAYLDLNALKAADASVKLYNALHGITAIEAKDTAACKLCALFLVTEGEDITKIDEALNQQKIEDWRQEGIDVNYFFTLAALFINGYKDAYKMLTQDTLAASQTAAAL